jgi:glycosyltransferase involved in cell wall biosynthesis
VAPNVVDNNAYWTDYTSDGNITLLFIGQLIDRKGIPELLDAYEQLNRTDVSLTLVGEGPGGDRYRQEVATRDLDVSFTGWVSEEEKRQYLSEADCFVLPSIEDLAPLVLNEAMAAGLPIVTTEGVGNASEMVTNGGNGYIVPAGDADALATALTKILSDKNKLTRMGSRSCRVIAEHFSPAYTADQFVAAISAALD